MGNSLCSDSFRFGDGVGINTDVILFNVEELNAYMDAFSEREFLGEGAFGSAYRGIISGRADRNINGREVAVKLFRRGRTHWEDFTSKLADFGLITSKQADLQLNVILFKVEELNAYMDAFSERKLLGKGAFGSVYRGTASERTERNINLREVAVKLIRNKGQKARNHWKAEKKYLPDLQHQNIIQLIGYCKTSEMLYLVYPFMENGTVSSKLTGLNWRTSLTIIKGIASAIQKLHRQRPPLIYRDLKLSNVLLDKDFTPKLADFGSVTPEQVDLQSSTRPHDIYKLGVIILQLIMKEENASSPRVGFCHISDWARRIYMQNKHAVMHIALTSTGCSERDAIVVTELAFDCVKAKATERPNIDEVIRTLGNL